jgi:predicted DNA-binding protein (MmcQ/YjbR family)
LPLNGAVKVATAKGVSPERRILSYSEMAAFVKATLAAKPGAVCAPLPSAPGVLIYKVMDKMFAILEIRRIEAVILKCDPNLAEILHEQYAGVGHRSHLDRRYWICVNLNSDVPAEEIERLATQSYELVRAKLTRKQKGELEALSS